MGPVQQKKRLCVKKQDENPSKTKTALAEGVAPGRVTTGPSTVPLDAPLPSKLDGLRNEAARADLVARLRLIEANLIDRQAATAPEATAPNPDGPNGAIPVVADVAKASRIAQALKNKPRS